MSDIIEKVHYQELAQQDPQEVCRRAGCRYDKARQCYTLPVWGEEFAVYPQACRLEQTSANKQPMHEYFPLFALHYLLTAKEKAISREWVSEKDIPGGEGFFRGPHTIPTHQVADRYNQDPGGFAEYCRLLQGTPLDLADTAFSFIITPRIPVAVLCWHGDEDFPPESKLLYDRSIGDHLALDIIFALATGVCSRLASGAAAA